MINRMRIILVVAMAIFGVSGISFAMSCDMDSHKNSGQASEQDTEKVSKATNVGNAICPVTGETIKESEKATVEYNSKIYNLCCPKCIPDFKNDLIKYSTKAEQSASSEHSMQQGHQH